MKTWYLILTILICILFSSGWGFSQNCPLENNENFKRCFEVVPEATDLMRQFYGVHATALAQALSRQYHLSSKWLDQMLVLSKLESKIKEASCDSIELHLLV